MRNTTLLFSFFATLLSIPFSDTRFLVYGIPFYVPEFIIIFTSIIFLWSKWYNDAPSISKMPLWINFGVLMIVFGTIFSFVINPFSLTGLGIIKSWFFFPLFFSWMCFQYIRTQETLHNFMFVWFLSFALVIGIALFYYFSEIFTYDHRLRAWYLSPNYLALFLLPSPFIILYLISHTKNHIKRYSFIHLSILYLFLIFDIFVIYQTFSYTVFLSIVISFFILKVIEYFMHTEVSAKNFYRNTFLFFLAFGVFVLFQWNNQKFQDSIHIAERSSISSRIMIWKSSLAILKDKPILGIGPGRFQEVYLEYQKYFPPYLEWAVPQPHNLYLAFWLQTSIFGLLGFLTLIFFWIKNILSSLYLQNKKTTPLSQALLGIMIATLIAGFTDTSYWKNDLAYTFWILFVFGIIVSSDTISHPNDSQKTK